MMRTYTEFLVAISFGLVALVLPFQAVALTVSPVRFETSGEPGQTLLGEIELFNEQEVAMTFYSSFENFEARGEAGTPYFTPAKEGLATWIKAPEKITLEPGERKTVPFSIQIPQDAEPGGHFAAIFWGTTPPQPQEGGQVIIGAKTGILVLLTVAGEIKGESGLLEFSTENNQKFFNLLPITFIYRFQNNTTDRIKPIGEIKIKNIFGRTAALLPANKTEGNVLPNSIRKFEVKWEEKSEKEKEVGFFGSVKKQWSDFHFGRYTAPLNLKYGVKNEEAKARYSFFIIPWQLLSIIIIVLLIIGFLSFKGIKRYNQWIIAKALKTK